MLHVNIDRYRLMLKVVFNELKLYMKSTERKREEKTRNFASILKTIMHVKT